MDEISLIRRAQAGDRDALEELIRFYYPYVIKFTRTMVQDDNVCEDLTQDTFLKLIRSIDRYDIYGEAEFSTYVITIAKRTCVDYFRRNRQTMDDIDEHLDLDSGQSTEASVEKSLDIQRAMELLNTLPAEQAAAIKLKYLEQQTLEEIAVRLDSQPKTIKSRIHNGMVKLRRGMREGGTDNE